MIRDLGAAIVEVTATVLFISTAVVIGFAVYLGVVVLP